MLFFIASAIPCALDVCTHSHPTEVAQNPSRGARTPDGRGMGAHQQVRAERPSGAKLESRKTEYEDHSPPETECSTAPTKSVDGAWKFQRANGRDATAPTHDHGRQAEQPTSIPHTIHNGRSARQAADGVIRTEALRDI
ncbi:hypothetical protein ONZ51_g9787 [Trametes cubensis]|uniref:Secreted protein n=1 Tax=Trametes cubensis TaxID=1111947 RepID=A0AAD7TL53_9APHY|nr:hypothetical protein ONZ51_g9787 [Trametes cubensis]